MSTKGEIYLGEERIGISMTEYNQVISDKDAEIALKDTEIAVKEYPYPGSLLIHCSDHRDFPSDNPSEEILDWLINNIGPNLLYYHQDYYIKMESFLDKWWDINGLYRYLRYANTTNVTSFPDVPAGKTPRARYLYIDFSYTNGPSWGDAGVDDIPTTWRQIWDLDRLYFQRNELTSDQQIGIVQGIERELLAGMGRASASLTSSQKSSVFYIYFTSNSSGRNDSIIIASLLLDGWVQSGSTRLIKNVAGRTIYLYYIP